jgi:hypothetical protein
MGASSLAVLWKEHPPSLMVWSLLYSPLPIPAKLLHPEPEGHPGSLCFNKSFFSSCGVVFVLQFLTSFPAFCWYYGHQLIYFLLNMGVVKEGIQPEFWKCVGSPGVEADSFSQASFADRPLVVGRRRLS